MYVKEKADKEAEIQAEQKYHTTYLGESRIRKKNKYKNLENYKKKPQTDKLNSTLLELKEQYKPMKGLPEKKTESKQKSELKKQRNFRKQESNNSYKEKED